MAVNPSSGELTLVANTAQSATVRGWTYGVWVVNESTTGDVVWARLDGTAATVGGAGCFIVLGARNFPTPSANVTVSVISTGTPKVSIEGAVPVVSV